MCGLCLDWDVLCFECVESVCVINSVACAVITWMPHGKRSGERLARECSGEQRSGSSSARQEVSNSAHDPRSQPSPESHLLPLSLPLQPLRSYQQHDNTSARAQLSQIEEE